jgi:hypothetical protein
VSESLRKQFFEGAGAKDMKLVTTSLEWRRKKPAVSTAG